MIEAEAKYIQKPWDGSKSRWATADDLYQCIPRGMQRRAKRLMKAAGRTALAKDDCSNAYMEPKSHDINVNGISAALGRLDQTSDATPAELASARTELESERAKARKALGMDRPKKNSLDNDLAHLSSLGSNLLRLCLSGQGAGDRSQSAGAHAGVELVAGNTYHPIALGTAPAVARYGTLSAPGVIRSAAPIKGELFDLADTPAAIPVNRTVGVIDSDFRRVPDWKKLGIDRPAGDATPEELALLGPVRKLSGAPFEATDVFSAGALLANNDIIEKFGAFIPQVELERLAYILGVRQVSSDQDHDHEAMSATFKIVKPAIGTDPGTKLHADHPLLGKVPYTGLITRLLYPKIAEDPEQMAAVAAAMGGKLRDKSIAFACAHFSCGLCGEMPVMKAIRDNGNIVGFKVPPDSNPDLMAVDPEMFSYDRMSGTIRTPSTIEGGYNYCDVRVLNASADGTVLIEPCPEADLGLAKGSMFLINMDEMFFLFFSGGAFCRVHKARAGRYIKSGQKMIAQFTQMRAFLNCAEAFRGAIGDARLVLDPENRY